MTSTRWLAAAVALAWMGGTSPLHAADDLQLSFDAGRVTVVAHDVSLRSILDAWAERGDTTFVDAHRVSSEPVSVEMVNVPEREALKVLLRSAGGYVVAPRTVNQQGASTFDRVLIMATARRRPARPRSFGASNGGGTFGQPQPTDTDFMNETAPPGPFDETDETEFDQLELLEELRGRYRENPMPADLFSQPSPFATQPDSSGDGGMQVTPRPGMVTSPSGQPERPRASRPIRPVTGDP